jgi:hypothetical protein
MLTRLLGTYGGQGLMPRTSKCHRCIGLKSGVRLDLKNEKGQISV